jgi:MFS transporter, FSR family, fosmidomycin resistance protein
MDRHIRLTALGIGHFFIDLLGIYLINVQFRHLSFPSIALYFIIYNLVAFGLQPFIGFFADVKKKYLDIAVLGLVFAMVALLFKELGLVMILLSTLGNAMYHVGGGVLSMNLYPNKSAPAGIFVAPGAVGVFLGVYLSMISPDYGFIIVGLALLSCVSIFVLFDQYKLAHSYRKIQPRVGLLITLILFVVLTRGFVGSFLYFGWKGDLFYSVLLVISIFLGKFFGGVLGDKFGYSKIGVYGLIISVPLLIFGINQPLLGLAGAFMFNLTMAITLFLIIESLGVYKGVAFGLTTLTLVGAFIPFQLGFSINVGIWYYSSISVLILSAAYGLHKAVNLYEHRKGDQVI